MAERKKAPRPAKKGGRVKWMWVWQGTGRPLFPRTIFKLYTHDPDWWAKELYLGDTDYGECLAQVVLG